MSHDGQCAADVRSLRTVHHLKRLACACGARDPRFPSRPWRPGAGPVRPCDGAAACCSPCNKGVAGLGRVCRSPPVMQAHATPTHRVAVVAKVGKVGQHVVGVVAKGLGPLAQQLRKDDGPVLRQCGAPTAVDTSSSAPSTSHLMKSGATCSLCGPLRPCVSVRPTTALRVLRTGHVQQRRVGAGWSG
jgi:hypothetical protein